MAYTPVQPSEINPQTNRFAGSAGVPPAITYDSAGNITSDNKFRSMQYQYDANGRMKWSANGDGSNVSTSVYDGLGQRVQTTVGAITRTFVYDIFGQVIAEYEGNTLKRGSAYAAEGSGLIAVELRTV